MELVSDLLGLERDQTKQSFITRQITVVGENTTITPLNLQQAVDAQDALAKGFFLDHLIPQFSLVVSLSLIVSPLRKNVHVDPEQNQPHNLPGQAPALCGGS